MKRCLSSVFNSLLICALLAAPLFAMPQPVSARAAAAPAVFEAPRVPEMAFSEPAAFTGCDHQSEIPAAECTALLALYNSTNGAGWWDHSNWLDTDTPCSWFGVICTGGHVTSLDQHNNNLNGSLPDGLGGLTFLHTLNLEWNASVTGNAPAGLSNLDALESLKLKGTDLSGALPLTLAELDHLAAFDAQSTRLCEPQDAAFQEWKALIADWKSPGKCYTISGVISWSGSGIEGVFLYNGLGQFTNTDANGRFTFTDLPPASYTIVPSAPNLIFSDYIQPDSWKVITITSTNIIGVDFLGESMDCNSQSQIPYAECAALVKFYSSTMGDAWSTRTNWMNIGVPAPCSWYGVTCSGAHVTALNLNNNALRGALPTGLSELTQLHTLSLNTNQITGPMPADLGNLPQLNKLSLNNNKLTGPLPTSLDNLSALQELLLVGNALTGSIPPELGSLNTLQILSLSNNRLSGPIPAELANLTSLTSLVLSWNDFTGPLPAWLGNFPNLKNMSMFMNHLTGPIPAQLGNLAELEKMDFLSNNLSGSIPVELGNLTHLQELVLGSNQLSGSIPPELGNLTSLTRLQLEDNHLAGPLPTELGNLTQLTHLYFDWNEGLYGSLPLSFTALTQIYILGYKGTHLCAPDDQDFKDWQATAVLVQGTGVCRSVSGKITATGGAPMEGVTLSNGHGLSSLSAATGTYVLADMPPGAYTITPSKDGLGFSPVTRSVTITDTSVFDQDFISGIGPVLSSLNPGWVTAGSPAFTLDISGENFASGTLLQWNGSSLTTTFINDTHLTAAVPAENLALPGMALVNIINPDTIQSDVLAFPVLQPWQESASALVGPASATLTFTSTANPALQTIISLPAGAFTETLQMVYTESPALSGNPPSGFIFAGRHFDISIYDNGVLQTGFTFEQPVRVEITCAGLPDFLEDSLELRYWDAASQQWSTNGITILSYDAAQNRLVVQITHLSEFALLSLGRQLYLPQINH